MASIPPLNAGLNLLPLASPRIPATRPSIPDPRPRIAFTTTSTDFPSLNWIATSHFYPAAWPRSHPKSARSDIYLPPPPVDSYIAPPADPESAKQAERRQRQADFDTIDKVFDTPLQKDASPRTELSLMADPAHHSQRLAEARQSNEAQLWSCVQRIVPVPQEPLYDSQSPSQPQSQSSPSPTKSITLVVCHANGFHKEIWEPALASLVQHLETTSDSQGIRFSVKEIWNFDCVHSGQAANLNRDTLGEIVSWFDHPRDVFQFLDNFLPASSPRPTRQSSKWLPTFLDRVESSSLNQRDFILLGHSFGATSLATAMTVRPTLFKGLIMVDPAMFTAPQYQQTLDRSRMLARGAIARKETFASVDSAKSYLLSKPFFQAWHPSVLQIHLRFGLRPLAVPASKALVADDLDDSQLSRSPVTLSNPKWHEAAAFENTFMSVYAAQGLSHDRHQGWVGLLSLKGGFDNETVRDVVSKLKKGCARRIEGGHLITQEDPHCLGKCEYRESLSPSRVFKCSRLNLC